MPADRRSDFPLLEKIISEVRRDTAGVHVTPQKSLSYSAVFAAVRVLSETVASLPLIVYERLERGKRRAKNYYLYSLLHDAPNGYMTSMEYRETLQAHLATWGNAYSEIEYDRQGRVTSLFPLRPDKMMQGRMEDGRRFYLYQMPNGEQRWFPQERIWHLRGLGSDGYWGYSPIQLHRKSVGLGLAAQEFGARFYANDARPGIILEHPGALSEEAAKNIKASWDEAHGGLNNAHRVAILEEGLKVHEVGIPPEDAQFLETRKFQVEEIARIYRVPPHMLASMDRATFSNIEQQSLEFVQYTMHPWFVRWEQSINLNLMLSRERERYYVEHLVDSLLRGDTLSRYQAYAQAFQFGWMSSNDIRERENMNPVEGGDEYYRPLNLIPADTRIEPLRGRRNGRGSESRADYEQRSATARHRLRGSYVTIYRDVAARILRREVYDVGQQARKALRMRDYVEFSQWLDEFYREHADYIIRQMAPVNTSYGEAVAGEAVDEISTESDVSENVERFISSYTGGFAARHTGISLAKLRDVMWEAQADPDIDPLEVVEAELETWEDTRSAIVADEESTRLNNAIAKVVYVAAGFLRIRSVAFGDNCPYCSALDGRVIGIDENFLSAGESFEPDGADRPLTTTTNIGHPPYHGGCDCMIVASL